MAQKKIPARQCIGCMTSRPKKELVRVVRFEQPVPAEVYDALARQLAAVEQEAAQDGKE